MILYLAISLWPKFYNIVHDYLYYCTSITYIVACGSLHSSEEEEQVQGEGNAQVKADKVVKSFNQLPSVEIHV